MGRIYSSGQGDNVIGSANAALRIGPVARFQDLSRLSGQLIHRTSPSLEWPSEGPLRPSNISLCLKHPMLPASQVRWHLMSVQLGIVSSTLFCRALNWPSAACCGMFQAIEPIRLWQRNRSSVFVHVLFSVSLLKGTRCLFGNAGPSRTRAGLP